MRILIGYASKTGTAAGCAEMLARELRGQELTVADLTREAPAPDAYDLVILGGSVRFGRLPAALRSYLKNHQKTLEQIPHGLFLCCGLGHEFEGYAEKCFERGVRESAFALLNFGGVLRLPNASLFERALLRWMRSEILESEIDDEEYTPVLPAVLPENISMMASYVRRELERIKNGNG